jgi:hypothetical protein
MYNDLDFLMGIDPLDICQIQQRGKELIQAQEFRVTERTAKSWDSITLSREQFLLDFGEEQ